MILRAIAAFFKILIDGTAKALAFLLVSLGLWLAAVYSLLFVIVAAITRTPLSTLSTLYLVGLCICVVAGFALTLATKKPQKHTDKNPRRQSAVKYKETEVRADFKGSEGSEQNELTQPTTHGDTEAGELPLAPKKALSQEPPLAPKAEPGGQDPAEIAQDNQDTQYDYYEAGQEGEQPMVFALRRDPTIFLYEYENKIEYYKRTRQGMVLLTVEYKPKRRSKNDIKL